MSSFPMSPHHIRTLRRHGHRDHNGDGAGTGDRQGGLHTSRGSRLLSEYNCCFHFHEKLFALELGMEIENQTLSSDSDPLQILFMKNIVSPQTANCGESCGLKRDVWGLELQPRVFTKRLIVSLRSRLLLLNGGSSYPRYFVLLKTLRVPREADPHTPLR